MNKRANKSAPAQYLSCTAGAILSVSVHMSHCLVLSRTKSDLTVSDADGANLGSYGTYLGFKTH